MNVELINPFLIAAKKVFSQMLGIDAAIGKPFIKQDRYTEDHLLIMLGVVGQVEGQVILSFDNATALGVAGKMCMMEMTEINEIAQSALCELGNMILGNAATVLSTSNILVDITAPSVVQGNVSIKVLQAENVCIPLDLGNGEIMEITVCIRQHKS